MRTLIITVTIFVAMCILMVLNYNSIPDTSDELTRLTDSLDYSSKAECQATLTELDDLWKKSSPIFSLTVSFREIDYLGETLLSLSSSFESGNKIEFEKYRSLLIDAIDGVSRLEKISVISIL